MKPNLYKKNSKNFLALLMACAMVFFTLNLSAQCINTTSYGSATAPTSGTASISTNVGGVSDIIEDNISGIVSSKELDDYGENLLKMIEDDNLKLKLAKNGKSISLKNYNYNKNSSECIIKDFSLRPKLFEIKKKINIT